MTDTDKTTQPDRAVEVGHGVLFIGFAKASFMVFGALQKILLARVVDQAAYGAFSVVNNAISIVNNTIVQGTIQSVSKFTTEDDARAGAVQRAGLKAQCILGVAAALVLPPLALFWPLGAPFFELASFFEEAFSGATCAPCSATAANSGEGGVGISKYFVPSPERVIPLGPRNRK